MIRQIALLGALLIFGSGVSDAAPLSSLLIQAPQPEESVVRVEATKTGNHVRLGVEIHGADVLKTLEEFATKSGLQIAAKVGVSGLVHSVSLKNATPEFALQVVCNAAGLSCSLRDGLWIVSRRAPLLTSKHKAAFIVKMTFMDIDVEHLPSMLATECDLTIAIDASVKGKIAYLKLENKTPREAVKIVAAVVNAIVIEQADGTLLIRSKPGSPPRKVPTPEVLPETETTGGFMLTAA